MSSPCLSGASGLPCILCVFVTRFLWQTHVRRRYCPHGQYRLHRQPRHRGIRNRRARQARRPGPESHRRLADAGCRPHRRRPRQPGRGAARHRHLHRRIRSGDLGRPRLPGQWPGATTDHGWAAPVMAPHGKIGPRGAGMPFPSMDRGQSVTGLGLADRVAFVLTAVIGTILFVGALIVITAVFIAVVLAAICVATIRSAFHAIAPHSGPRRVDQRGFGPAAVIETTGKVIRSTAPKPRR